MAPASAAASHRLCVWLLERTADGTDWRLADDATVLDMVYAVRADEAQHRFVNNTLSNVFSSPNGNDALNPFGIQEPPASIRGAQAEMTAQEALAWGEDVARRAREARAQAQPAPTPAH